MASAVEKLEGNRGGYFVFEDRPNQPWISIDAIAKELRMGKSEVWHMVHKLKH